MNAFMIVFRIIHITAGVIWVGSAFLFVFFLQPTAAAIGPAAAPFMGELLGKRRLVDRIIGAGAVTILAGLALYVRNWILLGSLDVWLATSFGRILTVGLLASLVALGFGVFGTRPKLMRFLAMGREVAASGGPPKPEVAQEMAAIQGKLRTYARTSLAFLLLAVVAMAGARYS